MTAKPDKISGQGLANRLHTVAAKHSAAHAAAYRAVTEARAELEQTEPGAGEVSPYAEHGDG